jgi:acetyl-CoA carboxylase beta subunit
MTDIGDLTRQLADVQMELWDLPEDAFAERFALKEKQAALRTQAAQYAERLDEGRSTDDLLVELSALRTQMVAIEGQRIDLVTQAGSTSAGEMGNLGGYSINKGIEDAMGLPKIKARIGLIKGILIDRGADVPEAD